MNRIVKVEQKLIYQVKSLIVYGLKIGTKTFTDFWQRDINISAASISFYAIFSVFPLLAFLVYIVSQVGGTTETSAAAATVIKILKDFVPGLQSWIENGLFLIIQKSTVSNWINSLLLAWAGLGFFSALEDVVANLSPSTQPREAHSHTGRFVKSMLVFFLFVFLATTIIFCEIIVSGNQAPFWMQGYPVFFQNFLYYGAKSGVFLLLVGIFTAGMTFRLLLTKKIQYKSALLGGILFTSLLVISRSFFWIYMHYSKETLQSTYGIFSALIAIMIWVHFIVNCGVFSCLFSYHLDIASRPIVLGGILRKD